MDKVKTLRGEGLTLSLALRGATGRTIASIAEDGGVHKTNLAAGLSGLRVLTDREVDALVSAAGGTRAEWRELLLAVMNERAAMATAS